MRNLKILDCGNRFGNDNRATCLMLIRLQKKTGLPDEAIERIRNWFCEQTEKALRD